MGVNFGQGAFGPHATDNPNLFVGEHEFEETGYGGTRYYRAFFETQAATEAAYIGLPNYNILRMSEMWEIIQKSLGAALDPTRLTRLTTAVEKTTSRGAVCIIDIHNYAKYLYVNMGESGGPTGAHLADLWSRLANVYKTNPLVWFGLMNEPIGFNGGATEWAGYAQQSVNAIRATGATNKILVPGIAYTGAWSWSSSGSAAALVGLTDSGNNFAFEVHQYADWDFSGTRRGSLVSETTYRDSLAGVTSWARTNGKKLFLGEYNTDKEAFHAAKCERALGECIKYMQENGDVWLGGTAWMAGGQQGDQYFLNGLDYNHTEPFKPERHDLVQRALMVQGVSVPLPSSGSPGAIAGTAQEGQTPGGGPGPWSHPGYADLGFEVFYQWQRSDNGSTGWTDMIGSTDQGLIIQAYLVGKYVRRGEYAKNIGGSAGAGYNAALGPIVSGTPAELATAQPFNGWTKSDYNVAFAVVGPDYLEGTPGPFN